MDTLGIRFQSPRGHKHKGQGDSGGIWSHADDSHPRGQSTLTKDEEDLHSQVTDTGGTAGSTGFPGHADTHTVGHSDSHVEGGKQDEAIPCGSQRPAVQQDEG